MEIASGHDVAELGFRTRGDVTVSCFVGDVGADSVRTRVCEFFRRNEATDVSEELAGCVFVGECPGVRAGFRELCLNRKGARVMIVCEDQHLTATTYD